MRRSSTRRSPTRSTKSTGPRQSRSRPEGTRAYAEALFGTIAVAIAHARWLALQRARNATQHPTARPRAPNVAARRRAARQRWRERQRIRVAAQRAAAVRYEGAQTPDGPAREAP